MMPKWEEGSFLAKHDLSQPTCEECQQFPIALISPFCDLFKPLKVGFSGTTPRVTSGGH